MKKALFFCSLLVIFALASCDSNNPQTHETNLLTQTSTKTDTATETAKKTETNTATGTESQPRTDVSSSTETSGTKQAQLPWVH